MRRRGVFSIGAIWYKIAMGASFCHVDRINPVVKLSPCRTSGNQKWKGASPSFIQIAMVIVAHERGLVKSKIDHSPVSQALFKLEKRRSADAAACVRKYFVEASMARGCLC